MRQPILPFALLSSFLLLTTHAGSQPIEGAVRKQATALQVPNGAVRVDGRLTEQVWDLAKPVADFVQAEPTEGAAPIDHMEVRFAFDETALFVGARMYSQNPAEIQAPMSRRDEGTSQAEHIFVSVDTYFDRRTAYTFGVTAAGVRFDHVHPSDNRSVRDRGFDPVWEARVATDALGWTAEMRIPFNQLRFTAGSVQVWGLNIYRAVPSRNEEVYWSLVRRTERVWASRFGELHGITIDHSSRRLELLPYLAGSSRIDPPLTTAPAGRASLDGRAGLDVKMGVGPNLTLEATVNPDFGQVEADPAEVNLTAFETFFSERRPFFLEGSRLLGAAGARNPWERGGTQYFYSRRIGARPPRPASGDLVEVPPTSTILGAGKLTGRLATGTSIGVLAAVTTPEFARVHDATAGEPSRVRASPWTSFAVGRIQQEFGAAGSTASLMVTNTRRSLAPGDPLAALLTRDAFAINGESLLRFRGGEYEVGFNLGVSRVAGDSAAIARLQRSSARYFQRPDATHVAYDPTRTALSGVTGGVSAERTGGRRWLWRASADVVSPEFEINDVGRLSTADTVSASAELAYRQTEPGRVFRSYSVAIELERTWNLAGTIQEASVETRLDATWPNFWTTDVGVWFDAPAQDQRLTRGGPIMGTPRGWLASLRLGNSRAARTQGGIRLEYSANEDGGFGMEGNVSLRLRPVPRWQLSVEPSVERQVNERQYVSTVAGGPSETFGRRYVFAVVDRTTLASEVRVTYALKPDLTVEFYGEPFAASGRFYDFGELAAAGTRVRRIYTATELTRLPDGGLEVQDGRGRFTLGNRDFNVISFRSNLVLRWEWRSGSTLYVVWQQDRENMLPRGDRVGIRDVFGSLGTAGSYVLAVKTTIWLAGR